jgi:threonine dehydrogenase-like Zn-dependent dehydrogenase
MPTPTTTRAAVLVEHGAELELQELSLPAPEPGAAIVRITRTTLCGTDVEIWAGQMSFPGMLPMVLGHEMVGEVVAVGAGATDTLGRALPVGSRIGWSESTCGHCFGCSILREPVACSHRGYGFLQRSDAPPFATGGLSEYVYVTPAAAKLLLPEDVPDEFASMAGCAAKTVLRAFDRVGGIRPASRVAIQGAGALGIFAAAVASICGAGQVIVLGAPDERLEVARDFGATDVVNIEPGSEEIVKRVLELTDGAGADHVFDFAGARSVGREALAMAAQRGTFVVVGSTGPQLVELPLATVMGKELTVVGSINGDISDYYRAIEFYRAFAGRMPWPRLFSEPVGLADATSSIRSMSELQTIKAVIDPSR